MIKQVLQIYPNSGNPEAGRIYDADGISPTLKTPTGGNSMPKIIEPFIVASRGRNPDNPSDRTEQRLEANTKGVCNTLTSVQKDNYVCEPKLIGGIGEKNFGKQYRQGNRIYSTNNIAMALTASPVGHAGGNSYLYADETNVNYRIRKLTPLECFRLMGFDDEDFYAAQNAGISNSQLYKQAGNSIVVDVLEELFCMMFDEQGEFYV